MIDVRELDAAAARTDVAELADLLIDSVGGGASLGFPSPLERGVARQYWMGVAGNHGLGTRLMETVEQERAAAAKRCSSSTSRLGAAPSASTESWVGKAPA